MVATKEKRKSTTKKVKVIGHQTALITETQEVVDLEVISVEERDFNFAKIWLWHLCDALELLGSQKISVLSHILANTNIDNVFIGTHKSIADKSGVCERTVATTMTMLQAADVLKMTQKGVYLVNPDIIFRSSHKKRLNVLIQYHDLKIEKPAKRKAKRN